MRLDSASRWSLDDIPYDKIEIGLARQDPYLLYLIAAASFVEITSDLYSQNLISYFETQPALQQWLRRHWAREEVQHGEALKRYVLTVWPSFDWESAYADFYREYMAFCKPELLGPTQVQELVARCVVETGTATFYTALSRFTQEPVLAKLADLIRQDEVRHYHRFYHDFLALSTVDGVGRLAISRTLWDRVAEVEQEDAYCALKHVFLSVNPEKAFDKRQYQMFRRHYAPLFQQHFPYRTAANMFVKPLRLNRSVQRLSTRGLATGAEWVFRFLSRKGWLRRA